MVLFYLATPTTLRFYNDTSQIWEKNAIGLAFNDTIYGIDINPNDLILYCLGFNGNMARLYTIDPSGPTAILTLLGTLADNVGPIIFDPNVNRFGFDVNPVANRIRVISNLGNNLAVNQNSISGGNVATTVNTDINPANNSIYAAAYTNNVANASSTQLFDIGVDTNVFGIINLYSQNPPNDGTVTILGPIATALTPLNADFDIFSPSEGINEAYFVTTEVPVGGTILGLYSLDLTSVQSEFIGFLESSDQVLARGFTIVPSIVPCLHPDTLVQVKDNQEGMVEYKAIKDLRAGDTIVDYKGKDIKLINNIKFANSNTFYRICKDAFEDSVPDRDFLIRGEHPILYKGKETNAKRLLKRLGDEKVQKVVLGKGKGKEGSVPVYSLATEKRTFVKMQNVNVCTWEYADLESKTFHYIKL